MENNETRNWSVPRFGCQAFCIERPLWDAILEEQTHHLYKKSSYIKFSLLFSDMKTDSNLEWLSITFDLSFLLENCFNLSKTDIDRLISNKSSLSTNSFFLLVEKNFRKEFLGRSIFWDFMRVSFLWVQRIRVNIDWKLFLGSSVAPLAFLH